MTPIPDANAFSEASQNPSFTDSGSTHRGEAPSEDNLYDSKIYNFTGSNLEFTPDQGLLEAGPFRHPPKIPFFT